MPTNLTKREQKQIKEIVQKARSDDGVPRTAQQSIPFQRMFPDGICRVRDNYYTKTIQFQDINYQLAQQEDKTAIFEEWCSFLNFFDSSIHFELSFMNMSTDADSFEKSIRIPYRKDEFNPIRSEYTQMLKTQLPDMRTENRKKINPTKRNLFWKSWKKRKMKQKQRLVQRKHLIVKPLVYKIGGQDYE